MSWFLAYCGVGFVAYLLAAFAAHGKGWRSESDEFFLVPATFWFWPLLIIWPVLLPLQWRDAAKSAQLREDDRSPDRVDSET